VRKVYNNVGVVFKGSGFYKTDSRTTTPTAKSETNATKKDSKPAAKTESKPATKSSE
jgi:predicted nucleic acid-binding Zn ribbon protein